MQEYNKSFFIKLFLPIIIGILVYLLPSPSALSDNAWLYLSIFIAMIIALILEPINPALIGLISITVAATFKVGAVGSGNDSAVIKADAAISWALSGFSNSVVWLIFSAFTIGLGFNKTGLGERIALYLVSKLGKSTLGLGYAISVVDLILAPFIPSNAARSGGAVYPIVNASAHMFNSFADNNPRKLGAYLVWIGLSSSCVTSSIFLTGQAPNPLALSLIHGQGVAVVDWLGWFLAFLPVGIIIFIITPLLAFFIYPPSEKGSKEVAQWAKDKLNSLGKMTREQIYMIIIALIGLSLWIGSSYFKINATTTALIVIVLMCATKVIIWQDFLSNKAAWNTLVWFATLVAMASGLKNVGFLDYIANTLGSKLTSFEPLWASLLLLLLFSWLRYFFASGTAYVTAIIAIFVSLASSIPNANPAHIMLILVLPMGFMGIITPYGTGSSPLWFGSHYIKGPSFFLLGGIFAAIYMLIYIFIGLPWLEFIIPYIKFA